MQNTTEIKRSRRLRKKLYLDEFAILGFDFTCQLAFENKVELDAFFSEFIDFIEAKDLHVSGGSDDVSFEGFITSMGRYESATEDDRTTVENWFSNRKNVSDVSVGELVDAAYSV